MLILKLDRWVIKRASFLIILICAICSAAFESQAFKTRAEIEAKAKAGDREAMFDHANCHNGTICAGYTSRNVPEAIKWFERAAKLGQKDANLMLGMIYCTEPGYQNPARGRKFLDKAIDFGLGSVATPLKQNCGKGGTQVPNPNSMIEMLMEKAQARGTIIYNLNMLWKKGIISADEKNLLIKYFEKASTQEVFIHWGFFKQGIEELLNFMDGGDCEYTKYFKLVLGEMGVKPDERSWNRWIECSKKNMKRVNNEEPDRNKSLCTLVVIARMEKSLASRIMTECADIVKCRMYLKAISLKHCAS